MNESPSTTAAGDVPPEADPATADPAVMRGVALMAFGETIMRFQLVELDFWSILAMRLKKGMTTEQALGRVNGWDNLTTGQLVGVLNMPEDLQAEARQAVAARNYLAHRFMRDRAMFLHDPAFCAQVGEELARVLAHLDAFEERLAAYKNDIGVPVLTDEDMEELGLSTDPADWFGDDEDEA